MTTEEISAVELNRVEKQVEHAEAGRITAVILDARTARALLEAYKVAEVERARKRDGR